MVRILGQDVPPSLSLDFTRCIGPPHSTGFPLYITGYQYAIASAQGSRYPFRMKHRQGFTAPMITLAQTTQRQRFRAALDVWALQPYQSSADTTYGPKGHNIWHDLGAGFGLWAINYFMSQQIPFEIAATPAPWDPNFFLVLFAGETGDQTGYVYTPVLDAGTYRVALLQEGVFRHWKTEESKWKYLYAVSVYSGTPAAPSLEAHIGRLDPGNDWNYEEIFETYDTQAAAWTAYTDDSNPETVDVTVDGTERILLQYKNRKAGDQYPSDGSIQVSITAV